MKKYISLSRNGLTNFTIRNRFTRSCIAEALLSLMKKKDFSSIRVTDIVKRAGISRMTYYKYYETKNDVLSDYLTEIVNDYISEVNSRTDIGHFHDRKRICHCFSFFEKHHAFFEILLHANLYSIIIDAINNYMDSYLVPEGTHSRYELYYYAGALLNVYIKWLAHGRTETPDEMAATVSSFLK